MIQPNSEYRKVVELGNQVPRKVCCEIRKVLEYRKSKEWEKMKTENGKKKQVQTLYNKGEAHLIV